MAKTEVVLDLSVDQGSLITELEQTKKVILGLKKEQQDLNKAYKDGKITQEEYVKELVRVEGVLKTSQAQYNNTQKAVTGVKTKMDDLIASNNKLASSVKQSTENIRVGGVTVGELTTKVTALLNPVTAAAALVTGLGAAYARSTVGAKDLTFASNQASAAITILTNEFASLISSAEDGEGAFSKLTNFFISSFSPALAASSKAIALSQEALEDQQRNEIILRQQINERLEENQELMTKIQDSQTDINEKTHLAGQIVSNLRTNEEELLKVKNDQLKALETQLAGDQQNEKLQDLVAIKTGEISAIKRDTERKVQAILKLESNLLDTYNKQTSALRDQAEAERRKGESQADADRRRRGQADLTRFDPESSTKEFDPQEQFDKDRDLITADLGLVLSAEEEKQRAALQTNSVNQMIHDENMARLQENLSATKDNFNQLAGLFTQGSDARKVFALLGIGADTASAIASLTANSEANPANAFTFGGAGIAQYAAGLIRILTNMAAAREFLGGSFGGGADFVTSKPSLIMVGDNPGNRERVTVEPLSGRGRSHYNPQSGFGAFAGGGSLTFDGASSSANATVTQALIQSNAIKNMPRPVVGVKQIVKVMNEIEVKQNASRA